MTAATSKKGTRRTRLFRSRKSPLTEFVHLHFVKPLTANLGLSLEETLELWLGLKHRDLYFCKVTEPFKMPGVETQPHPHEVMGTMNREVKRGSQLTVRIDSRSPERIDVDWHFGDDVRTFKLSNAEYELLREKVEILDDAIPKLT